MSWRITSLSRILRFCQRSFKQQGNFFIKSNCISIHQKIVNPWQRLTVWLKSYRLFHIIFSILETRQLAVLNVIFHAFSKFEMFTCNWQFHFLLNEFSEIFFSIHSKIATHPTELCCFPLCLHSKCSHFLLHIFLIHVRWTWLPVFLFHHVIHCPCSFSHFFNHWTIQSQS